MTGLGAADRGDATPPRGRRITIADRTLTVVGVARNGRYDYRVIDDPLEPVVYYSIAQTPGRYAALHVCTEKAAFAFAPAIHQAMLDVDPAFTTLSPISPFQSGVFDAVICMHAAHVLDDLSGLLAEMRRILKPGGKLFLTSLLLVDSWRDRYLRMLCRRGIMAPPRREEDLLAAVRMRFGAEPAASVNGSMLFVQVTKPQQ